MHCSDGFTYSTHSNTWIGPIPIFSNRYDTEYDTDVFLRYRHRYQYCDVTKLTGKSRDLVDQVQGCLTLWTLVVVQYFLAESTTQIDKSKILKIFQLLTRSLSCSITHGTLHMTALFAFVMTRRTQAQETKGGQVTCSIGSIDTSRWYRFSAIWLWCRRYRIFVICIGPSLFRYEIKNLRRKQNWTAKSTNLNWTLQESKQYARKTCVSGQHWRPFDSSLEWKER